MSCLTYSQLHKVLFILICIPLMKCEDIQKQVNENELNRNVFPNENPQHILYLVSSLIGRITSGESNANNEDFLNNDRSKNFSRTPLQEAILFLGDKQNFVHGEKQNYTVHKENYSLGVDGSSTGSGNKKLYFIIGGVAIVILIVILIVVIYCCCCHKKKKRERKTTFQATETNNENLSSSIQQQLSLPIQQQLSSPVQHQLSSPIQHQISSPIQHQLSSPIQQQPISTPLQLNVQHLSEEAHVPVSWEPTFPAEHMFPSAPVDDSHWRQEVTVFIPENDVFRHNERNPTTTHAIGVSSHQSKGFYPQSHHTGIIPLDHSDSMKREIGQNNALPIPIKDFENTPTTSHIDSRYMEVNSRAMEAMSLRMESGLKGPEYEDPRRMVTDLTRNESNLRGMEFEPRRVESDQRMLGAGQIKMHIDPRKIESVQRRIEVDPRRNEIDPRRMENGSYPTQVDHTYAYKKPYPMHPKDFGNNPNYNRNYQTEKRENIPVPPYSDAIEGMDYDPRYMDQRNQYIEDRDQRRVNQSYNHKHDLQEIARHDSRRQEPKISEPSHRGLYETFGQNDRRGSSDIAQNYPTTTIKKERYKEPYSREVRHELSSLINTKNMVQKQESNRIAKTDSIRDDTAHNDQLPSYQHMQPNNKVLTSNVEIENPDSNGRIKENKIVSEYEKENKVKTGEIIPLPDPDYQDQPIEISDNETSTDEDPVKREPKPPIKRREFKGPYGPEDLDEMNNPYTISRGKAKKLALDAEDDEY